MRPGDGAKSRSGSSALSRASTAWPSSRGRSPSRRPPPATWSELDQVGVGRDLGDGVLDLEPGVHLEEGEELLARVVEELDRAGAGIPHGDGEALGRGLDLGHLRRERGRVRRTPR